MIRGRRAAVLAILCAPAFAGAAPVPPRRRLVVAGFAEMHAGPNGLDAVVRILGERGFAHGGRIEVLRVVIERPPKGSSVDDISYLASKFEREVLPLKPDVILVMGSPMTTGARRATRTIPIVTSVADPVELGVADSLARPGGNVTGLAQGVAETSVKTMEMMKALVPRLARVAIFHGPRSPGVRFAGHFERAARSVGLEPVMVPVSDLAEATRALRDLSAKAVKAAFWAGGEVDNAEVAREAIRARVPLVGPLESFTEIGFLASYVFDDPHQAQRLAAVVEQVLRGADPAVIAFQYPQSFRLAINKRTATAIGLKLGPDLLVRADRVIE
jgi:putative ABC transport system substrate-binding protein